MLGWMTPNWIKTARRNINNFRYTDDNTLMAESKEELKSLLMKVKCCSVMSDSLWPHDCSLPGTSLQGIFQARILEWVATSSSSISSQPREPSWVSRIAGRLFTVQATKEANYKLLNMMLSGLCKVQILTITL